MCSAGGSESPCPPGAALSKLGTLKSQRALAVRHHGADSPQARDAAEKLKAEKTAVYVERLLKDAPDLTEEQRTDLAELLRPVRKQRRNGGAAEQQPEAS